uniref:Vegetative storage protein n=1 Tax=Glycine tomentella TaxID=44015 RepID=Q6QWF7_GLYTO|nr:vegetative storage protein [Glycine tomentella]
MKMKVLVFFVATILVAWQCHAYNMFPLRMNTDYAARSTEAKCASWRLAVEAQNIFGFKTIPEECVESTKEYIHGGQYESDSKTVNQQAYFYARDLEVHDNDVFVFSIDATVLSNVPYYSEHGYGVEKYNSTLYDEWVNKGVAPALPQTLINYNKLLDLGFKIVFLSGRTEDKREVTEANLKAAGYHTWHQLILKDPKFITPNALAYKSAMREKLLRQGYSIKGIVGDQWSDHLGDHRGDSRSFKLPNPMYYIE